MSTTERSTNIASVPTSGNLRTLLTAVQPFLAIGVTTTIAGGVAAAITRPAGWEDGSWVAAFLVLVVGIGQIGLAVGQAALADHPPSSRRRGVEAGMFNAGSGLVIAGTLATMPAAVTVGAAAIAAALVVFASVPRRRDTPSWAARAYIVLLVVLIVSTPIGVALAWTRR